MPTPKVSREARRELVLRALRREESIYALAREAGISRQSLHDEVKKARDRYEEEYAYWAAVRAIERERTNVMTGRKRVGEMALGEIEEVLREADWSGITRRRLEVGDGMALALYTDGTYRTREGGYHRYDDDDEVVAVLRCGREYMIPDSYSQGYDSPEDSEYASWDSDESAYRHRETGELLDNDEDLIEEDTGAVQTAEELIFHVLDEDHDDEINEILRTIEAERSEAGRV